MQYGVVTETGVLMCCLWVQPGTKEEDMIGVGVGG